MRVALILCEEIRYRVEEIYMICELKHLVHEIQKKHKLRRYGRVFNDIPADTLNSPLYKALWG